VHETVVYFNAWARRFGACNFVDSNLPDFAYRKQDFGGWFGSPVVLAFDGVCFENGKK
jgi:hypothetical protein